MKTNKTILSLATVVALSISAYATCATDVDMGTNKITTTATTFSDNELVTKSFVDTTITESNNKTGFVADHEGWIHPTITIGTQIWMADNMYVTTYNGSGESTLGDPIAPFDTIKTNTFSYPSDIAYGNGGDETNSTSLQRKVFGNLYQYDAIVDRDNGATTPDLSATDVIRQGLCPTSWHVPNHQDWILLEKTVDVNPTDAVFDSSNTDNGYAGTDSSKQLKVGGTSGMNILIAGYRNSNGSFLSRGTSSIFWTASEDVVTTWRRAFDTTNDTTSRGSSNKKRGYSLRCIKD